MSVLSVVRPTHYSNLKNSGGSTQGSTSSSSNGSRRRAVGTQQEFYKFILRRKTMLSDSRGKAPVVSFMFEPKEGSPAPVPLSLGNYHKFRVVNTGSVIQLHACVRLHCKDT
eukprot:17980-Heterococcus_DN1.PRE.3